jgi:hypothetical protein
MSGARWSVHLKREALINAVTNALANGGIGWLLFKDEAVINAWHGTSQFGVDLLATAAILSLILAAILQPLQRRALLKNTDLLIGARADPKSLITWDRNLFPFPPWLKTIAYYPLAGLLAAALTLGVLSAFGLESFSALEYSLFKGAWTGVWAALLTRQIIKGCAVGMINGQRAEELDRS